MSKLALVTMAAAALAAAAPAAEAQGRYSPQMARFVAYLEAKQVTQWSFPRYRSGNGNCQGIPFREGKGEQTIRFRTKPLRLLVTRYGNGPAHVTYGTWNRFKPSTRFGLDAGGKLVRTGRILQIIEPDWCWGGGPTVVDTGPYDCGERPFNPDVLIGWKGNRVRVDTDAPPNPLGPGQPLFRQCPLTVPLSVLQEDWTAVTQRYPLKDVFDRSQGLVEVLGRRTWTRDKIVAGVGTATTTATFKLRLRRAR
jgi:hypothetical protein